MLVSSFVLIFVCAFGMMALPVDWLVAGAWCVVIGSAVAAWWLFRKPATTLEYDHFSGRISIDKSNGQSHSFLASDIRDVGRDDDDLLEQSDCTDDDDDDEPPMDALDRGQSGEDLTGDEIAPAQRATITYRDASGKEQTVSLAGWSSADSVAWLVAWLQQTLRLKS